MPQCLPAKETITKWLAPAASPWTQLRDKARGVSVLPLHRKANIAISSKEILSKLKLILTVYRWIHNTGRGAIGPLIYPPMYVCDELTEQLACCDRVSILLYPIVSESGFILPNPILIFS